LVDSKNNEVFLSRQSTLLSALFADTFSLLLFSWGERPSFSPYKATFKLLLYCILNILILAFLERSSELNDNKLSRLQSVLNVFSNAILICYCLSQIPACEFCHSVDGLQGFSLFCVLVVKRIFFLGVVVKQLAEYRLMAFLCFSLL
jgi:hypothetical protein